MKARYGHILVAIRRSLFLNIISWPYFAKKGETYKAIGFWMDQSTTAKPALSECARTIDELEELTGLDFFHNLPDNLENAVEAKYAISAWTGLQ